MKAILILSKKVITECNAYKLSYNNNFLKKKNKKKIKEKVYNTMNNYFYYTLL